MDKLSAEELKGLVTKALADVKAQQEINTGLNAEIKSLTEKLDGSLSKEKASEILDEISDLRAKIKAPVTTISTKEKKDALREIARKSFNTFIKDAKDNKHTAFGQFFESDAIADEVKTLGIGDGSGGDGTAAGAVAEILSMDLIEYAREYSPILSRIAMRAGLTRDYRELVLSKYPTVADGIENVAGTDFPATDTQEYGEVKTDTVKLMANAPITDEAFYGTTYNVYSDLVRLLGDEISVTFAAKVMFGNGTDKNGRGILSSARVDITNTSGESWKPTMGAGARSHDVFPAVSTGVAGDFGATDEAIQDFVEDTIAALPTKYLGRARWTMNRKTRARFAKVRDGNGRPVFKRNMIEDGVDMIAGFPVDIDDTMPDMVADAIPVIFGDLNAAFGMSNGDISYMQLNPYKTQGVTYVEHNHEIFTIMQRSDAVLMIATTVNAG